MWWMHDQWDPWAQAAMIVGMVVFWAAIIGGGTLLARAILRRDRPSDAHAILEQRLARGEIDVTEYEARRDAIARSSGPTVPAQKR